jgi:RNA recognition motif-containing protein
MKNKLFVAGISYQTRDNDLKEFFTNFGEVLEAKIVMERENPSRSRGFGFVTMATEEQASEAIAKADGAEFDGRNISVRLSEDKPREDRKPYNSNGGGYQRRNF